MQKNKKNSSITSDKNLYPSSVLAPFCPGKRTETVKIHLLVISRRSELHKNQAEKYPKRRQALFTRRKHTTRSCPFTSPNAEACSALQHLTTLHEKHHGISPCSPGTGPTATAAEDRHTGGADAHPARGDTQPAGTDGSPWLPALWQPTHSLLRVIGACFHSAQVWHFLKTGLG